LTEKQIIDLIKEVQAKFEAADLETLKEYRKPAKAQDKYIRNFNKYNTMKTAIKTTKRKSKTGQLAMNFDVPVRHAKRTRKSTAGARNTIRKAKRIYEEQKESFVEDFKAKLRKGVKPTVAAKEAGKNYRTRYGATRSNRWKTALNRASRER